MDCKIFRKKLSDLIEDNISYDLKDAMMEHITKCEACRSLYDDELTLDETLEKALSINPQNFRSLREDILKNIDKKRYSRSPIKKVYFHFKKFRRTYTSMAALIALVVFVTPYIIKNGIGIYSGKSTGYQNAQSTAKAEMKPSLAKDTVSTDALSNQSKAETNSTMKKSNLEQFAAAESYMPKLQKKSLDKTYKVSDFITPYEYSLNRKYSATVVGKGEQAIEEAIANIVIKDLNTGDQWSFDMLDNAKQLSPKFVKWIDDENVLVIIGLAHGTVDLGGDLYVLNINTAQVAKADPTNSAMLDNKSEIYRILSVKTLENKELEIGVEILVFDDEIKNKTHIENRTIISPFYQIVKYTQPVNP